MKKGHSSSGRNRMKRGPQGLRRTYTGLFEEIKFTDSKDLL